MALSAQSREVYAWLEELFGDECVPEFEINPTTIQYLHQLMLINNQKDHKVQLIVKDLEQKTNEYNAEAQRLSAILSRLNMGPSNLSQSGANCARILAKLGTLLDVKDSSTSCYFLAIQNLDDQLSEVLEQRQQEAKHLKQLASKTHSTLFRLNSLNAALDSVKAKEAESLPVCEKRNADIVFLVNKIKKYGKDISKLQMQLVETKLDESTLHENLVKKYEMLKSMQDKLKPMREQLKSYASLPPDISEVKIKIEQQKKELAQLEKKITESIDESLL